MSNSLRLLALPVAIPLATGAFAAEKDVVAWSIPDRGTLVEIPTSDGTGQLQSLTEYR